MGFAGDAGPRCPTGQCEKIVESEGKCRGQGVAEKVDQRKIG